MKIDESAEKQSLFILSYSCIHFISYSFMSKDFLYALLAGVAYICVVSYVVFDVADVLNGSITEQRFFVPLSLGGLVFTGMVYYLVKNEKREEV